MRLSVVVIVANLIGSLAFAQQDSTAGPVRYRSVAVQGVETVRELRKAYGAEGLQAILHINRIDLEHLRDGATLIVPESPASLNALSPFPLDLERAAPSAAKLLVVSRRVQAFAAYEAGRLARWGAVSTGRRETQTPAGLFATNWRSKLRRSSDNAAWLLPWYFN